MFHLLQLPADCDCEEWRDDCDELMDEFTDSPEGRAIESEYGEIGWAYSFLEFEFQYLGLAPPDLSRRDVKKIVFSIFPRKVSAAPETAGEIIAELRAFFEFLQRRYRLDNAKAILRELGPDAEDRLERELADPRNCGMAKSLVMMGMEAGFDMTTEEGLSEFMHAFNSAFAGHVENDGRTEPTEAAPPLLAHSNPRPQMVRLSSQQRKAREKLRRRKLAKTRRRR